MAKKRWSGVVERNLSFVNEVSAGIGLVVGYLLFGLYWLSTPDTTVEVTTQAVQYEEKIVGYLPEPQILENVSDVESLERTVPVTAKFPKMNEQGTPALIEEIVSFRGKGTPVIYVEQKEVVVPKVASDDVQVLLPNNSRQVATFYLETVLQGTGYYYQDKRVTFDGVMSADIFAIRIGTLFALLSLILLLIRVKAVSRSVEFIKGQFSPGKGDGFITEETLVEHYRDAMAFVDSYEKAKRKAEARYFEQFEGTSTAYAKIKSYLDRAEQFLQSSENNQDYVLCSNEIYFIDPPIHCEVTDSKNPPDCVITTDPLIVKSFTREEAEFFSKYLMVNGYPLIEPVSLVEVTKDMREIYEGLRKKLEIYFEGKSQGKGG